MESAILLPFKKSNSKLRYQPTVRLITSHAPLVNIELPDGRIERTIAVGLIPKTDKRRHRIVGVNMINQTVNRFDDKAPQGSQANDMTCGLPYASQPTARHILGQVWVTVTHGSNVLWRFLAVRPAAELVIYFLDRVVECIAEGFLWR